jgi:hypothetical protein
MINNEDVRRNAVEQIKFFQKVLECEHEWEETGRYPSPFNPTCAVRYKCDKCKCHTGETVEWNLEQHIEYYNSKLEGK